MTEKPRKTIIVPEDFEAKKDESEFPFAAFIGWNDELVDGRDVSKPIGLDAEGRPVWAPRGIRFRV